MRPIKPIQFNPKFGFGSLFGEGGLFEEHLGYRKESYKVSTVNNETIVTMDLPGVPVEKISVEIVDRLLKICWTRDPDPEQTQDFTLDHSLDRDSLKAHLKDGVLTLTLQGRKFLGYARKVPITT